MEPFGQGGIAHAAVAHFHNQFIQLKRTDAVPEEVAGHKFKIGSTEVVGVIAAQWQNDYIQGLLAIASPLK
jgi:hypothetical protein